MKLILVEYTNGSFDCYTCDEISFCLTNSSVLLSSLGSFVKEILVSTIKDIKIIR